jgi:hypothetical protein
MHLTLQQYLSEVESGTLYPRDVVSHYVKKIQEKNAELFSFVRLHKSYIDNHLEDVIQ